MAISNKQEITCPCGYAFEAELLSAISVSENPELKEALLAGEINLVECPHCGEMFYAENFILYHDRANELIAFVYPLSFQNHAARCNETMQKDFKTAVAAFGEDEKINYEPLLIFGIEDLVLMLKNEQDIEDEEMILTHTAKKLGLETVSIAASLARKIGLPKVFPVLKNKKEFSAESIIPALKIFVESNDNLTNYAALYQKFLKNASVLGAFPAKKSK